MKPLFSLKDLLPKALSRSNIGSLVVTPNTVRFSNQYLALNLPSARKTDAKTISSKGGLLTIEALNSSCAQYVKDREKDLLQYIRSHEPKTDAEKVLVKIVGSYRGSEPV